ncbi:MAG TPA: gliding motility-associated C-terminal domain-containing protein [Saprospiraceae bacterium]|nr:gliding motility-associated C-terminal domain-containing protein [Saprospiraceae bacterium]
MHPALLTSRLLGLLCLCTALSLPLHAQSFISRYRTTNGNQGFLGVRPLKDGRIIVGGGYSVGDRALATMLTADGNILWSQVFGGQFTTNWTIVDFAETTDGNLLALMNVNSAPWRYSYLVKLSKQNGQFLSAELLGDDDRRMVFYQLTPVADGFVLAGAITNFNEPQTFCLLKTDLNGAVVWQRSLQHASLKGSLRESVVAENGHIWALAALENGLGTVGRFGVLHFDESGNLQDAFDYKAVDPQRLLSGKSMAWQPGVGPVLGSNYYLDGTSGTLPLVTQLDTLGQVIWSKVINTTPSSFLSPLVRRLKDGRLLITCAGTAARPALILKLNPDGSVVWARDYIGNESSGGIYSVSLDAEENLYVAGDALATLPNLERKGLVIKTDDPKFDDDAGCCSRAIDRATLDAPITGIPLILQADAPAAIVATQINSSSLVLLRQTACKTDQAPVLLVSDSTVCPDQCVTFRVPQPGNTLYTLTIPGAIPEVVSFTDSAQVCFPLEGVYDIQLDDSNCVRSVQQLAVQQRVPEAFSLPDTLVCPGACLTPLPPSADNPTDYVWAFEGGTPSGASGLTPPEVCFELPGIYQLRLYISGCGFSARELEVSSRPFRIPNAFTPNGDGTNDVFRPLLECPEGAFSFEVYNRWGQKVFSTTDPESGWDGVFNNQPALSDIYVWRIYFGETNGAGQEVRRMESGEVSLIR